MYVVTRLAPELDIRNTVVSRQANSRQSVRCLERAVRSWISAVLEMESESVIEQPHRSQHYLSSVRSTLALEMLIVSTVVISELWDCMAPTYSDSLFISSFISLTNSVLEMCFYSFCSEGRNWLL